MNFKQFISLIGALMLTITASGATTACNNSTKTALSTIKVLTGLEGRQAYHNYLYSQLNWVIARANEFKNHELKIGSSGGYWMEYYNDNGDKVSNNDQIPGPVYVEIMAFPDDPYWTGTSNHLKIILKAVSKT